MGARTYVAGLARRLADALDGQEGAGREAALRNQVKFTNDLIDSVPVSLVMRDAEGKYLFVNRTWEKWFGAPREEVVGTRVQDRLAPDAAKRVLELDRATFAHGPGRVMEVEDYEHNGRHYTQTRSVMTDDQGRVLGVLSASLETSERREYEARLAERASFISELLEALPVSVALRDSEGRFLEVNKTWEEYLGIRREDALGKRFSELPGWQDDPELLAIARDAERIDREALGRGPADPMAPMERLRKGRVIFNTRRAFVDAAGRPAGVLTVGFDVTERRAMEQALATEQQRLREQIALTQAIVAQTPNAIFAKDAQGRFTLANRGWSEMSGVPAEKALGRTVHEIYPPELAARFAAEDESLIARGAAAPAMESVHQGPRPGQYRIVRKAVLSTDDGMVMGLVCSSTDISELKRIEAELRDQMVLTRALFDSNPNAMYLKDTQGRYVTVNDAWLKMVGLARERAIGRDVLELFPEAESRRYHAEDLRLLASGDGSSEMESLRTGPDGEPQWVIIRKRVLRRADGSVVGLIGTNTDITELKRIEAALATEQRRLALVVHAAKVGIVDWDGATHATFYSPRFREILGYPPDADTSGWPDYFKVLIHPEERERVTARWRNFILGKGPEGPRGEYYAPEEYRLLRADGSYVWVQVSGVAVRDARGFVTRWIAAVTDITERRAHEDALKDSVRLREEVERMSRHDLKTPLNSVIAVSRLLREGGKLSREDEELLSIVERAGYRILSMVNLSLDLYRMESGIYQFRAQAIDLMDVARKVAADLEGQAASKNVALRLRQSGGSLARAEELLCYSMLANLVKNAIEATPEGQVVSVTVEGAGDAVSVHVHNPGAVPAAVRARFFDKYASSGKSAGLGLGTYSARLMARVQEGDITLDTGEAEGTTVSVRLGAAAGSYQRAETQTVARAERLPELAPQRVLVVDDDEFNRLVLRRYLPSPPLTVTMAVNGRAALDAARRDWPDVVLLDLEMPVMDGYEATRHLRELEHDGRKRLTIIAISSNDDEAIVQRALAAGCDHYLVKPAPRELLFRLLAGETPAAQATVRAGDAPAPCRLELEPRLRDKVPAFLESRRALIAEALAAIGAGDRAALRRCAHRLAGSFALFGFAWASAKSRSVENDSAAGVLAELGERLAEVRAHLDTVEIGFPIQAEEKG